MTFKQKHIPLPNNQVIILEAIETEIALKTYKVRMVIAENDSQIWLYAESIDLENAALCLFYIDSFNELQQQLLLKRFYFTKNPKSNA